MKIGVIGFILLLTTIALGSLGCLLLYSTSGGSYEPWAMKQVYAIGFFLIVMIVLQYIPLTYIYKSSYLVYLCSLGLLIFADIIGHTAMGAQRWLRLGEINFQPSELCKLTLIMSLARYFHDLPLNSIGKVRFVIWPLILTFIPVFFIIRQPNLGTAAIIILLAGMVFFVAGIRIWKFIAVLAVILGSLPLIWYEMHDYQKQRVMTFLHPEDDILGSGYNIMQSKIAIGSGGLYGKGLLQGTQTQLSFLPEKHTDFIFTVLAEEFGFYGVSITILLYSTLFLCCYIIALKCHHSYSSLISIGIASMLFIHLIINTSMIAGLIPVVGTPLPFLSYARSSLGTAMLGIGLVLNSYSHRKQKIKLKA